MDINDYKTSRVNGYIYTLLFLLALFIPLTGSLLQSATLQSDSENRMLTAAPDAPTSIKALRHYPEKFDLYYKDNFGFRDNFLWLRKLQYWLGDSPSDKVTLGKDGWLFFNGEPFTDLENAYRGIRRLSEPELATHAAVLQAKHDWLKRQGIKYLFVIAPNKHSIYSEHLPDYLFKVRDSTLTDQFFDYIQQHTDVPVLDLRQSLLRNKTKDILLYYQTDSHWNHFGSNIAQYEIAKVLASFFPDQVAPVLYKKSDFKINRGTGGDLSVLTGLKSHFNELYPNPLLDQCAKRPTPEDGDYSTTFTTHCSKSKLDAVIFRDSFFEYLYQYMSLYFNSATFISGRLQYDDAKPILDNKKPDIVIEEWAERYLTSVPLMQQGFLEDNRK